MSKEEWVKKWAGQAPGLPQPDVDKALAALVGKGATK
jgi:hypothetical protein